MQALLAARLALAERQLAVKTQLLQVERKHANLQRIFRSLQNVVEEGNFSDNPHFWQCSECGQYDWYCADWEFCGRSECVGADNKQDPPVCLHCGSTYDRWGVFSLQ